jgi:hypothetical protein
MSSFWKMFSSVSSKSGTSEPSTTTTTTTTNKPVKRINPIAEERKRVASLREEYTSHPLIKWDNDHVVEWLTAVGYPQYCEVAKRNLLTGASLLKCNRQHMWDNEEYGLGIEAMEDLKGITEAFDKRRRQVIVRVYDVTGGLGPKGKTALLMVNKIFRSSLGGAYHCGVEVYGLEWAFGDGGIYCTYPKREVMGHHFREVVCMPNDSESSVVDRCMLDQREVRKLAEAMKPMWPGSRYDLVHCNCCHFADEFCKALGMGNIPPWINRAAKIGANADITWLSSNVPEVNKNLRGTKEEEQAIAMIESATQLFKDGLITREEYRNLREKHKRYIDEVNGKSGPPQQARIQATSVKLADANIEARKMFDSGSISKAEYDMIVNANGDTDVNLGHRKDNGRERSLTKQEKLLGPGYLRSKRSTSSDSSGEVIELEI